MGMNRPCICTTTEHSPETCNPNCGCPQCWDTWADEPQEQSPTTHPAGCSCGSPECPEAEVNAMSEALPKNEAEVIQRLKKRPKGVKMTASKREDESIRQWVIITYEFKDKLSKLGKFLYDITCDVEQAGGWVTQFDFGTPVAPENPTDKRPHGRWWGMHVDFSIKTQAEVNATNEFWNEAIRNLFKN
jgi:hypothetical protein